VTDHVLDRLRDRLPLNLPYEGLLADAYDAWIPVDSVFPDDVAYELLLADVDGPVLELGCGTGRPLLRWLAAGHDVEGIDASADMLAILRATLRLETYEPDGRLVGTWLRRLRLRWWSKDEVEALLREIGFVGVQSLGDDDGWVTVASRPA